MTSCLLQIPIHLKPILQYSGKYFQYFGQYEDCLSNPHMNYNFVTFKMSGQQTDVAFVGLCLPKTCTIPQISQTINNLFQSIKYPFEVSHINNDVPQYNYGYTWAYYITIIFALMCTFFVFYASINKNKTRLSLFSIQQSIKIFKYNSNSNLNVLNGVRSLAMMWVIIGHTFTQLLGGITNISSSVQKNSFQKPFYLFIQAGLFSVDVFFFVGGLLVAYSILKDSTRTLAKYPVAILQRILRFWPSYIFAILFFYSIYEHLGSGPIWGQDENTTKFCEQMWRPILFVDNFVNNGDNPCMAWGWYLQNDMQLFIFSIGLLIIYKYKPLIMKIVVWPLIIGSLVFTFAYTYKHEIVVITHIVDVTKWGTFFQDVYQKPWARAPPYLLGLFFGVLHHQFEFRKNLFLKDSTNDQNEFLLFEWFSKQFKQKKIVRIFMQWFGIIFMLFLVIIPRTLQVGNQWQQWQHSLYQATGKFLFVTALYLTIFPSLIGCKNSVIRFAMDTLFFNFIAKISFCTYLIHLTLVQIWVNSRTYSKYYTNIPVFVEYCGLLVICLFSGLIMTFMIEVPFSKIQKMLIGQIKNNFTSEKPHKKVQSSQTIDTNKMLNETLLTEESEQKVMDKNK